jgi:hypothetical protein
LLLERFIQQFVPMVAKKHKQFGPPNAFDDLFLLLGEFHWGLPKRWLHLSSPGTLCFLELTVFG